MYAIVTDAGPAPRSLSSSSAEDLPDLLSGTIAFPHPRLPPPPF
jgi:hypothetical protein